MRQDSYVLGGQEANRISGTAYCSKLGPRIPETSSVVVTYRSRYGSTDWSRSARMADLETLTLVERHFAYSLTKMCFFRNPPESITTPQQLDLDLRGDRIRSPVHDIDLENARGITDYRMTIEVRGTISCNHKAGRVNSGTDPGSSGKTWTESGFVWKNPERTRNGS